MLWKRNSVFVIYFRGEKSVVDFAMFQEVVCLMMGRIEKESW